jgi:hypothetical protein
MVWQFENILWRAQGRCAGLKLDVGVTFSKSKERRVRLSFGSKFPNVFNFCSSTV